MNLRRALRKKYRISWCYSNTKSISRELLIRLRPQAKIISWISVITSLKYADQSQPSSPQFTWRKKHFTIDINHLKLSRLDHIIAATYDKCSIFMKNYCFYIMSKETAGLFFLGLHSQLTRNFKKYTSLLHCSNWLLSKLKSRLWNFKIIIRKYGEIKMKIYYGHTQEGFAKCIIQNIWLSLKMHPHEQCVQHTLLTSTKSV